MEKKLNILLAEDDENLGQLLFTYLQGKGFSVNLARNGKLAYEKFTGTKTKFDFLILDVMMPEMDGFTLAKEIREIDKQVPVLFLTAKSMKEDQIKGYNLGADDYITKPFDSDVLLLKIKAILKRNEEQNREVINTEYDLGQYHFIPKLRELSMGDKKTTLSPKENELLKMLSEYKNDLLQRDQALKKIWGNDNYFNGRSMDVYIAKLRKYLKEDPNVEIVNIHGNGFRLIVK